ncbi:hypothetical protein D5086_028836 [Populus alba]|uniref:Uncharacterized protein n=1 Tax=Populus alba TaxID=43335 RepID=A0ACC4ARY8_POPAL
MEVLSLQILLILFFLTLILSLYALFPSKKKPANKGFKVYPIVGALLEFLRNRHRFLEWTTETLSHCPTNTAVFHRPGEVHGIVTANPLNVLDLQDILERFAFDNTCKVAFNVDPACLGGDGTGGGEFMRAFEDAATLSFGRFMYVLPVFWKINRFFNVRTEKTLRESVKIVHEFADEMIRSRMEQKTEKNDEDLLSRFIGKDEDSTEFLRDIVISFILAGRDTTSSALSWFFWLLSLNPDVERNILKELETIRSSNGKNLGDTYSFEELRDMHYLQAAISETLRLYPPVPVDTKACQSDDVLPDEQGKVPGAFVVPDTKDERWIAG